MKPMSRTPENIEDELLVLLCQEGDGEALKALITRWQPRFVRFAWRLTAEREASRDVVQDAWLVIVRGIARLDDPARFRAWAYRIVKNKCADWIRRRVVQQRTEGDLQNTGMLGSGVIENRADSADEAVRTRDALAKLPGEQRAMLALHYLDGMGIAEIARVLEVPRGTVKSKLYHARKRLKQTLERVQT